MFYEDVVLAVAVSYLFSKFPFKMNLVFTRLIRSEILLHRLPWRRTLQYAFGLTSDVDTVLYFLL